MYFQRCTYEYFIAIAALPTSLQLSHRGNATTTNTSINLLYALLHSIETFMWNSLTRSALCELKDKCLIE